jgi:hypothetical protein
VEGQENSEVYLRTEEVIRDLQERARSGDTQYTERSNGKDVDPAKLNIAESRYDARFSRTLPGGLEFHLQTRTKDAKGQAEIININDDKNKLMQVFGLLINGEKGTNQPESERVPGIF